MLMRGIFPKSVAAHRGEWIKSAANSWEVRGKTLGIVGYGNIGAQLSVLAEALGMHVILLRPLAQAAAGPGRGLRARWTTCWPAPTWSRCTCRTPRPRGG